VCNIDNGFGAAFAACKILNLIQKKKNSTDNEI
jgi:NCAIR mutase (PurE)-related protein